MSPGDLETALAAWRQRFLKRNSGHAHVRLSELLMSTNRDDEALEVLEEGLAAGPVCHGGLLQLSKLLLARGRDIEARSHLLRLLAQDPENTMALAILAEHARADGRWEEASRFYQRLTELDPGRETWVTLLEEVRSRQLARPRGQAAMEDGAGRKPVPTMTLVDIYLAQGYRDRALAVLRDMAAVDPERTDVQRRLQDVERGISAGLSAEEAVSPVGSPDVEGRVPRLDPEHLAIARQHVIQRRAKEKQQFQAWVDNLRQERNH